MTCHVIIIFVHKRNAYLSRDVKRRFELINKTLHNKQQCEQKPHTLFKMDFNIINTFIRLSY
jgi:hypothetical protein